MDAILETLKSRLHSLLEAENLHTKTLWYFTTLTAGEIENNINGMENFLRETRRQTPTLMDSLETENLYLGVRLEDIRKVNSGILKSIFEQHEYESRDYSEIKSAICTEKMSMSYSDELMEYLRSEANADLYRQMAYKVLPIRNIYLRSLYDKELIIGECCFENKEYDIALDNYYYAARMGRSFRQNHFHYEAEIHYKIAVCYLNLLKYDKSLEMLKKSSEFIELKRRTLYESYSNQREIDTLHELNKIVEDKISEVEMKLNSFTDKS